MYLCPFTKTEPGSSCSIRSCCQHTADGIPGDGPIPSLACHVQMNSVMAPFAPTEPHIGILRQTSFPGAETADLVDKSGLL